MCGIAGFAGMGTRDVLESMTGALRHRGPDGQALFCDSDLPVYLGHSRLAIIDLAGGAQPMWNEEGNVGVIFNGEIYNHAELRDDLLARNHRFASDHSDTEVLVHGYEEWGAALVEKLNGMFAFAIFDRRRRRLFLARDRFGEKPLYYCRHSNGLAFASELTALALHPGVSTTPSRRALQKYFAYGYIPAPLALFDGCAKLPGGCHLTFDLETYDLKVVRYWRFRIDADESLGEKPEPVLAEQLRALFVQAVKRRLMSDVPLGLFLSGGIDSSGVLAGAAQQLDPRSISTFTIGFDEPSFDESDYGKSVARLFGTRHHEEKLALDAARSLIPQVLGRLDEPLADPSIIPTFLLSRFTRQHVTVALSGDGGDEMFAGYDPFKALGPARLYRFLVPRGLHHGLRRLADLLPISTRNMSLDFKLRRTLAGLSYPPEMWNPVWMAPVEPAEMAELFEEPMRAEDLYDEAIALWDGGGSLGDRTLEFYANHYLQDDILMKVDRASMMASLESRAVFLDNDLVEFCRRLPYRFKYRNGTRKYLLKKALAPLLPSEVLTRRKKGFGIPVAKWLRVMPDFAPTKLSEMIQTASLERRWTEHRVGRADHRLAIWSWLALQQSIGEKAKMRWNEYRGLTTPLANAANV
jgi:asparagine synthase (glutamine-hydrolysing)